jgi:hypothetical protein
MSMFYIVPRFFNLSFRLSAKDSIMPFPSWVNLYPLLISPLRLSCPSLSTIDGVKIRVNAREELGKLIAQFTDDCAKSYNKITEDYNHLNKITTALKVCTKSVLSFRINLTLWTRKWDFPFPSLMPLLLMRSNVFTTT